VQSVDFSGGVVDFERREVRFKSQKPTESEPAPTRAELSEKETELVQYLVANSGRAISREELLSSVWRLSPKGITTRTIDMHIARLREKMRENKERPATLLTVRGKGYMWSVCENGGD
jgi:DNA-binding response OmpR family regulator